VSAVIWEEAGTKKRGFMPEDAPSLPVGRDVPSLMGRDCPVDFGGLLCLVIEARLLREENSCSDGT